MVKIIKKQLLPVVNLIQFILSNIFFLMIKREIQAKKPKSLILIRLDSIGDYILLHNFFSVIRNSEKYKDCNITFCGNVIIKKLVEAYDAENIDNFIWIDRKKYYYNLIYRYKIFKQIYHAGFTTAIDTTYTREILLGDSLIYMSNAFERIGSAGSDEGKKNRKFFTDKFYTKLIPATDDNLFEFYRNKEFFEGVLETKIVIDGPSLPLLVQKNTFSYKKYILIATGAQQAFRKWSKEKFAELAKQILHETQYTIMLAGSSQDKASADYIETICSTERIINCCGTSSLPEYAELISHAAVVISNDTGAIHIAAAFGIPFVCISNGNHFGRFNPYPLEIFSHCRFVYPPVIESGLDDFARMSKTYRYGSSLDINQIRVEDVWKRVTEILHDCN